VAQRGLGRLMSRIHRLYKNLLAGKGPNFSRYAAINVVDEVPSYFERHQLSDMDKYPQGELTDNEQGNGGLKIEGAPEDDQYGTQSQLDRSKRIMNQPRPGIERLMQERVPQGKPIDNWKDEEVVDLAMVQDQMNENEGSAELGGAVEGPQPYVPPIHYQTGIINDWPHFTLAEVVSGVKNMFSRAVKGELFPTLDIPIAKYLGEYVVGWQIELDTDHVYNMDDPYIIMQFHKRDGDIVGSLPVNPTEEDFHTIGLAIYSSILFYIEYFDENRDWLGWIEHEDGIGHGLQDLDKESVALPDSGAIDENSYGQDYGRADQSISRAPYTKLIYRK
jgi:hypothetical protein